ncbi:MAG: hemerythrin family protein, partial [Firmicutes bacterium]|nr:hemerythrin family protein [Bacillota bacterium]
MALIEWSDDLSVGFPRIDAQHKELFAQVNELLEASHAARGKEVVGRILSFLEKYVVEHFNTEEEFMAAFDYPDLASHRAEHRQFVQDFSRLKEKFDAEGPGVNVIVMTNHAVVNWLNRHIRNSDKALGRFLKERYK